MISSVLSSCWNAVLELLFPSCCPACGKKIVGDEDTICDNCLKTISRTEHAILAQNGLDLQFAELIQKERRTIRYEQGAAFAYYNRERGQILRKLIERGKFGQHPIPEIFYRLGYEAACEYIDTDIFEDIDYLVPIPLHPRRLRTRGFNQAEYICKGLSDVLHVPIDTEHLYRVQNNPHQSRSRFENRQKNVIDIFAIRYPEEWKNKHILLVDDVVTSGATMLSCMKLTTPIRGCRISVFVLGWARK